MRIYKNGSDQVEIGYADADTADRSTAFLIEVSNSQYRYSYVVPYAENEDDAVAKFMLNVQRLIEFQDMVLDEKARQEEEFEVPRDVLEVQQHKHRLRTLEKEAVRVSKHIARVNKKLSHAMMKKDEQMTKQCVFKRSKLIRREEELFEAIREARKSLPPKTIKQSVRDLSLGKQFEIQQAYAEGGVSATRLPAHRMIPVAYFDDSRGEIGHITSCYLLPVTGELPSWAKDVPR
jgi:hypothetical protein